MTLSNYIFEDLKSHIEAGHDLPYALTLAEIAEHYGVSLTPVRIAVDTLVTEQYLCKGSNGRLSLGSDRAVTNGAVTAINKPAHPPDWREILTRDVMLASLRGDTGFLPREATDRRYGVSRTIVRQIFNRLTGNGLLEHMPRSGWRVRCFDEADMSAYLEVREVLELKALDLSHARLNQADLVSMLAGNPVPQPDSPFEFDNHVHAYLVAKAENFYLPRFF